MDDFCFKDSIVLGRKTSGIWFESFGVGGVEGIEGIEGIGIGIGIGIG